MSSIKRTENPRLVEQLAQIRHEQVRSWTQHLFVQLNEVQAKKGTLDDFGRTINALCADMWHDYKDAPDHVKTANLNWAENILKVVRQYET